MSHLNGGASGKSSWFWGIVLSLFLHGIILLLALFWGFGPPRYSSEVPSSIEGELVSLSDLQEPKGEGVKPSQIEKKEPLQETKKEEIKKVEEKKEEPPQPEKKEVPQKPKKEEIKKAELEKKVTEVVPLETKKEKKEEKKQVAKRTEPTEPLKEAKKKEEPDFEKTRQEVLEELQKITADRKRRSVIEDIEKKVAQTDSLEEGGGTQNDNGYLTGRSISGSRATIAALFVNKLRDEIRSNWRIPENIPIDGSLRTVIDFKIDESGRVYDVRVVESSGNPQFDDFCVKAIYRASPLRTPVPAEILEEAKTEGIEVSFNNTPS
jgi:colicin import membrane protein